MKKNKYPSTPTSPNSVVLPLTPHQQKVHDAFTHYLSNVEHLKAPYHHTQSLERRVDEFFRRCMGDPTFTSVYDCIDIDFLREGLTKLMQNSDWADYDKRNAGTLHNSLKHYISFLKANPSLMDAIQKSKSRNDRPVISPDEYHEGAERYVHAIRYERDRNGRQKCLDHYGYVCAVCGMDFEKAYGEIGHEFIEVHHIIPLPDRGGDYILDPIKDLRPLCSNCHSMIHRTNPLMTIEKFKELYERNRKNNE